MDSPERARAWTGEVAIPTYDREPDSPHPPFLQGIYPYTVFGDTLGTRRSRTYQAVFLENRYLILTILPELGGRVISALDKLTGREIFYHNHVIKPGKVDARNAWIAGGLEFSFPIAHTPTCLDPIDATWENHPDGSASVFFGETERLSRMKWLIELRLPHDRALIQVSVRLYNPTPVRHRWQYWSNAAIYSTPGLQFIYPMRYAYMHAFEQCIIAWPDYKGVDRSWYRNNGHLMGTFGKDVREDFFGAYDHDQDAGVVHWADHREVPGKKTWTWGTGPDGLGWATVLSDEDGPYSEIQSGRCETQVEFNWLEPRQVLQWEETWYPVAGIGGFCHADRDGAVNLRREGDGLEIGLCLNREISGGRLIVAGGGKTLYERTLELGPGQALREKIPGPIPRGQVNLRIVDESGAQVLAYMCSGPTPGDPEELARLNEESSRPPKEPESAEEFCLRGIGLEKHGDPWSARKAYASALERDPGCYGAHLALGILHLKAGDPGAAEAALRLALERDPDGHEARYHLALALRAQGRVEEAEAELWRLVRVGALEAAACSQLGEMAILRRDFEVARGCFNRALGRNPQDGRSVALLALCMRKLGKSIEAAMGLEVALRLDPLDFLAECERCFLVSGPACGESPEFGTLASRLDRSPLSWLELSLVYSQLGLLEEAAFLLEQAILSPNPAVARDPILRYHLADVLERLGDTTAAGQIAATASEQSPERVFPHCVESIPVLERASSRNPGDARAPHYLGNLYFAGGRIEEAVRAWERSAELDPSFPVVHRNLGLAYRHRLEREGEAIAHYERAVAADPEDAELVVDLDQLYGEVEPASPRRRALLEAALARDSANDAIAERLVACLLDAGEPALALELLTGRKFVPRHGPHGRQALYTRARIQLGEIAYNSGEFAAARTHFEAALTFPETLGEDEPMEKCDPVVEGWIGRLKD